MSVALLAINSFYTLFLLPSNTDLCAKFLIAIIWVEQYFREGWGGGGGGGRGVAENAVPSAALPKQQSLAAIGFHGTCSTIFIFPWKMLIGFYFVNLAECSNTLMCLWNGE